ncbi:aminotransferase class I/II-fold pyridoxal phosphate-dependent enzyme [Alicyclobacillus macrosporangiidus]|uniref:Arginine/lysine/ornithine decarboxylase n=1 Tax=Alicyclobacillus macrosporangiidus TaxID=392015 RepID=A0A1I7KRP5_9BACL|nr:aminotransferase class I/II-fold pyridoxal phosphate-dependent enzyme [Alicyclobacillus macrosporangiidus]SFV00085.1 Arginine/lysine/ornithine decarboxylase [Alicyclobacillus macrosporangiidus]
MTGTVDTDGKPGWDEAEAPILAALVRTAGRIRLPLFVPGHKQGRLLPGVLSSWLGAAAKIDLTELPGLDNLHRAEGCILRSEALAAAHYGAEWCLFSVNGSTAGVMAALLAAAPGGKVVFAGPFHESAWRGLVVAGAEPVLIPGTWDAERQVVRPPAPAEVARMLADARGIRAVYVTSPTYAGVRAPVRELAEVAHRHGVPLIVDEAHGAHFGLVPELPPHSIQEGADVVVQSVHKMLPGLTQTAWVLGQGGRVDRAAVVEALSMLQTTSPSYLLLASLDAAQLWLRTEGADAAARAVAAMDAVWQAYPHHRLDDPLRHFLPTGGMAASRRVQSALQEAGIWVEYADPLGVLSVFGLAAEPTGVGRYLDALTGVAPPVAGGPAAGSAAGLASPLVRLTAHSAAPVAAAPREVFLAPRTWVPAGSAAGRVAAGLITPYPPGVPVVLPGQTLDEGLCAALSELLETGYEVHGVDAAGRIPVMQEGGAAGVHHV